MAKKEDKDLKSAILAFLPGKEIKVVPVGNGLINVTFRVTSDSQSIILQRLNPNVFISPADVIANYNIIEKELLYKRLKIIPSSVFTASGSNHFVDDHGRYWRATKYIEDTIVSDHVNSKDAAGSIAKAFGELTHALKTISNELRVIIPRFHDLAYRYDQFIDAVSKDPVGRVDSSRSEIKMIDERIELVSFFKHLPTRPALKRVMHHDAKVSNILFDRSGNVVSIVDLDTCQPGYFFSDLGDMIRTITTKSNEDVREINDITVRSEIYHSLVNGYLSAMGDELTTYEKDHIHMSGLLMVYMQAIRFLTDHINGDTYYKINYPEHNIWRARNQLKLLSELENKVKAIN